MKEQLTHSPNLAYSNSMESSGENRPPHIEDNKPKTPSQNKERGGLTAQYEQEAIEQVINSASPLHQGKLRESLYKAFFTQEKGENGETRNVDIEKGDLPISREMVERNAAIQDDDERADVGEQILKRFEEERFTLQQREAIARTQEKYLDDALSSEQKRAIQREAIIAAHNVGSDDKEARIYSYTHGQLREKYEILQKAGYSRDQIRVLMEHGVVGIADDQEPIYDQEDESIQRIKELEEKLAKETAADDAKVDAYKSRVADEKNNETSSGDPQFPSGGETIEAYLREIAINTGLTVEEVRNLKARLDTLIDLNAEHWRVLMQCERKHSGYLKLLSESMSRVNMSQHDYELEARELTKLDENKSYSENRKIKLLQELNAATGDNLTAMYGIDGPFQTYYRHAMNEYKRNLHERYDEELLGFSIEKLATEEEFTKAQMDYYRNEILPHLRQMQAEKRSEEDIKEYIKERIEWVADVYDHAENNIKKENRNRQIESIEELAEAIMDTHPEFAQGTEKELIYSEDVVKDGKVEHKKGDLNQENFMNWVHSQLQYYHDQDPDNPQMNFMTSISIDIPEMLRTVNIITMINNPGRYFKDRNGVELVDLKNEVTNATWLWGDIRNKDITYRLIMPMDEKIGEALMNMYQNNVLTKMTGDGTPPLHWILSQAERFGDETGDKKIGMAILESLMIYYNLTDFPELYEKYAGKDSPMFNLKEIEETVQELIVKEKRGPDDSYLSPEDWATLRGFFKDGKLAVEGNEEAEIEFAEFFNIYAPERDPRVINLVRELVMKTVKKKFDLSDENVVYAEQFSQFFLRFTLAAARADLGAPAMDAGEKVMRLYLHEKGPNATNPGYGNVKAVALRRALGLDFFAGTYVLGQEHKNQIMRKVKDSPVIERENKSRRYLGGDEEVIMLHPRDVVESDGHTKWLRPTSEKRRKFYEDIPRDKREENQDIDKYIDGRTYNQVSIEKEGRNTIVKDLNGQEIFNFEKEERKLKELYGEDYEIVSNISSRHIANKKGKYTVDIQLTVRKWNTAEYTQAASHKRAVIKRHPDGLIEVVEELGDDDKVIVGKDKDGKNVELSKSSNQQIVFIEKVIFKTSKKDAKSGKLVHDIKTREIGENEYYDAGLQAICEYPSGKIIEDFPEAEQVRYVGKEKYIVKKVPRQKSTLKVIQDMHKAAQEYRKEADDFEKKMVFDNYGEAASQLAYKTDTMRQYASNHLGRIFQMFHEELDKDVIDVTSMVKGWDEKKQRWVFDESKIQDIFTEQLYKRRRYAYRTYGIYMGEVIRGIAQHDKNRFETMTVAEHLFGRAVLDTFRRKDGTIDYEYLSSGDGIGNLFKTELIMRLAAEESKFSDKKYPEKGMALHLKLAYRDALRRAIASGQIIDEDDPSASIFKMETFKKRKISEDPEENEGALDFMDIYTNFVGATDNRLIFRQGRWEVSQEILPGLWDSVKKFVGETAKG